MTTKTEFKEATTNTQSAQQRMHYVSRVGVTPDEVTDIYKTWADSYDNDVSQVGWNAPKCGCDLLERTLKDRKTARILDAASGTGLGGKMMKERGYTNIDALDACQEMLDKSKQYGAYTNYINAYLGKNRLPIEDDTYDMIITYGSFVPGHVNEDCFMELARVTKPGGYIGLLMCERYFRENPEYAGNIEPRMRELQEAGVWTRIRRELFPRYHGEYDGIEFVLQLNDDKNKALQTLE